MRYNPEKTTVTVVGGGNIGTQFACICASKGYRTVLYCSQPDVVDCTLECINEFDEIVTGKLSMVTSDLCRAVSDTDVIFVTYPAFMLCSLATEMLPFIKEGVTICVVPGTGGAEFAFLESVRAGAILAGLQRVPSVARLEQRGKRVRCEGLRDELFLAGIPSTEADDLAEFMSFLWSIPCKTLPNYLSVTLTPSNPILHTTRLCTLFADYYKGKLYDRNPLFYGEWNDKSSELLIACDEELQKLIKTMDRLDLHFVKSLKEHYESYTTEAMTEKLCSIKSLHNLRSPMIRLENGWIPDFNSRYFTADFPYGLAIIEAFAEILDCDMPNIEATMNWYRKVTGESARFNIKSRGINCLNDIYNFYIQSK